MRHIERDFRLIAQFDTKTIEEGLDLLPEGPSGCTLLYGLDRFLFVIPKKGVGKWFGPVILPDDESQRALYPWQFVHGHLELIGGVTSWASTLVDGYAEFRYCACHYKRRPLRTYGE